MKIAKYRFWLSNSLANSLGALVAIALLLTNSTAQADLVAGWDFQTTANGGTAVVAAPNTPNLYVANFGSGTFFLNGQEGSSTWVASATSNQNELAGFSGTIVNAGPGFSTTTTSPAALALVNSTANGKSAVFKFSMAGFKDLIVSYATQRTGTGFTSQTWAYSTDATNWTDVQVFNAMPASFATQTLNTITALDNASNAYLRLTLAGATANAGNNRFDNFQFNATAVPEPTSMLLLGSVTLGGWAARRYRRR
jgi:hypothetical protein